MINPIAPHGPVSQDPPGLAASADGGDGDAPFDNFLPDQSSPGTPMPADETTPPVVPPRDPRTPDPMKGIMPRPIRWKEGKNPPADSPVGLVPQTGIPLQPVIQPWVATPTITLSPGGSPATAPLEDGSSSTAAGSLQTAATAKVSGTKMMRRGVLSASDTAEAGASLIGNGRPAKTDGLLATAQPFPPNSPASLPVGVGTEPRLAGAESTVAFRGADSTASAPDTLPVPEPSTMAGDISTDVPTEPPVADALPMNPERAASPVANLESSQVSNAMDSRLANFDRAHPLSIGADLFTPSPIADLRAASPVALAKSAGEIAPATFSAIKVPDKISGSPNQDRAKIAGPVATQSSSRQIAANEKSQTAAVEELNDRLSSNGTPVAKDEPVLNAALSTNEKESLASPFSKRGNGAVVAGSTASSRTANFDASAGGTLTRIAVPGIIGLDASATEVTGNQAPDPTAARQVVKVETLLKNALSAGESIRPNGSDHLEMRVHLDGGNQDVMVRLQVTDDRMQVTFQTNSPEMQKALEHGWEQFSADASQGSSLLMNEPRFETNPVNAASQHGQTNNPSFSSGQQDSRRQNPAAPFSDELMSSTASGRPGFAASTTIAATARQPEVHRWSGWA